MPGNAATPLGTLTVNGGVTFNAGSFYAVNVTPSANSSTLVTGAPATAAL